MKKYLIILISLLFLVSPLVINAKEQEKIKISDYSTLNFTQVLDDEEIAREFKEYEETDDQITIYLFRGKGCGYCRAFLNFMNSITTEYGSQFKIVSFETWYDKENSELLDTISTFMGSKATGVPYIIIGVQAFPGFAESYGDSIKAAITTLYDSKDRYDVFEEYNKEIDAANREKNAGFNKVILLNLVFISISTIIIMLYIKIISERMFIKLEELNNKQVVESNKEEAKKPIVRKTTTKKATTKKTTKKK